MTKVEVEGFARLKPVDEQPRDIDDEVVELSEGEL